jgi:hypothetical protein
VARRRAGAVSGTSAIGHCYSNGSMYANVFSFLLTLVMHIQVGCPLRCSFCATGKGGFARNLQPHEIVEQVVPQQPLCFSSSLTIVGVGHRGDVQTQGDKCCVHGDG